MNHQPNSDHQADNRSIYNQQPLQNQLNNAQFGGGVRMEGGPVSQHTNNNNNITKTVHALPYVLVLVGLTYAFLGYLNQQKTTPKTQQRLNAAVGDSISTRVPTSTATSVTHHYYTTPSSNQHQGELVNQYPAEGVNAEHKTYTSLKKALAEPAKVFRLALYQKKLLNLPESIGTLYNLQKLYLTGNELKDLPKSFIRLGKLTHLYARNNRFKEFPKNLLALPKLANLYLSGNKLRKIPAEITQMQSLQILHLSNNRLKSLPESIAQLKNLRRLYLKGNPISDQEKEKIKRWLPSCTIVF